jgi:WXXGXW repeat (2 copies)
MSPRQSMIPTARNTILLTIALAGSVLTSLPAAAGTEIITDVPPPLDRVEHAPPPRDGYVWSAGHWEWNGRAYAWESGTWIVERRAAHWAAGRWEQVGAQWHYVAGHWER